MTSGDLWAIVVGAAVLMLCLYGWLLVDARRRRPVPVRRQETRPMPAGLVRGFAWSTVALTDMFLDEEPSERAERAYTAALCRGVHRYEDMARDAQSPPGR